MTHEDDRERLTNADIKADLKRDIVPELAAAALVTLLMALLVVCCVMGARVATEKSGWFWIFTAIGVIFSLLVVWFVVNEVIRAIPYIRAICRDRFAVTDNKLLAKQEGRGNSGELLLKFVGMHGLALCYMAKNNRYEFTNGTYQTPPDVTHYRHSKKFDMSGKTLFRHSNVDDPFWVVSFKPGKIAVIYPQDMFDYTDSSPM